MNDYISRQDAIDAVNAYFEMSAVSRTIQNMTSVQEILKQLPSAQLERKTTHLIKYWTERKDGYGIEHIPHCKCANCGVDYLPRMAMDMNYCPNCGARFIKERDNSD